MLSERRAFCVSTSALIEYAGSYYTLDSSTEPTPRAVWPSINSLEVDTSAVLAWALTSRVMVQGIIMTEDFALDSRLAVVVNISI